MEICAAFCFFLEVWGAHAPRVLISAPRRNVPLVQPESLARRQRQHARRVRSPEQRNASRVIYAGPEDQSLCTVRTGDWVFLTDLRFFLGEEGSADLVNS
jgi:hypothetical protein